MDVLHSWKLLSIAECTNDDNNSSGDDFLNVLFYQQTEYESHVIMSVAVLQLVYWQFLVFLKHRVGQLSLEFWFRVEPVDLPSNSAQFFGASNSTSSSKPQLRASLAKPKSAASSPY